MPKWLIKLTAYLETLVKARSTTPMPMPTDSRIAWMAELDKQDPNRLCHWCFHPRNSQECWFGYRHYRYIEFFDSSTW